MDLTPVIDANVRTAIEEDVGSGDLTALLTGAAEPARATVIAREAAVVCGQPWFEGCYRQIDPSAKVTWQLAEGSEVAPGATVCTIAGAARRRPDCSHW